MPHYTLDVQFTTGRRYVHPVANDDEASRTIEGWKRSGGFWVVDAATSARVWCPWHTVTEVRLPTVPHSAVVGGRGPAVRRRPLARTATLPAVAGAAP